MLMLACRSCCIDRDETDDVYESEDLGCVCVGEQVVMQWWTGLVHVAMLIPVVLLLSF